MPKDLAPEEIAALREEHDLVFFDPPAEASAEQAEREANRLLKALGGVRAEMAANQRVRDDEVASLDQWLSRVNRTPKRRETWLLDMLEHVARFVPRYGKKKSRDLPNGTLEYRRNPERLVVEDPTAAALWAKAFGLPTQNEETVAHADLAKVWKEKGLIPAGCTVEPEEETFTAKPKDVG